jgi:hypothetical protein
MGSPGLCDTGCVERKLMLVREDTVDALTEADAAFRAGTAALRPVADTLRGTPESDRNWQAAYASLQTLARAAILEIADDHAFDAVLEEPADPAITWWCPQCDGVDAPQPCLGICVWRTVDWVRQDIYEQLRERVLIERDTERQLRSIAQGVAHTTPRPGQDERTWRAFASRLPG